MNKVFMILCAALALTACKPNDVHTMRLSTYDLNGKYLQGWVFSCTQRSDASWCNAQHYKNSRTLGMGDSTEYFCSPDSKLYVIKTQYRASQSFPVEGVRCKFEVTTEVEK